MKAGDGKDGLDANYPWFWHCASQHSLIHQFEAMGRFRKERCISATIPSAHVELLKA
jgi:hypothetical protein